MNSTIGIGDCVLPAFHASHTSIDATGKANGTVVWGPRNDTSYFTGSFWACFLIYRLERRTLPLRAGSAFGGSPTCHTVLLQALLRGHSPPERHPWQLTLEERSFFARSSFPKRMETTRRGGAGVLQGLLPRAPCKTEP